MVCRACGKEMVERDGEHIDVTLDLGQDRKVTARMPNFGRCKNCTEQDLQKALDAAGEEHKNKMWEEIIAGINAGAFFATKPISLSTEGPK